MDAKMAVYRLSASGVIDATFGTGGVTRIEVPGDAFEGATSVTIQPDGGVVAAGFSTNGGVVRNVMAARLLADGSLDATFGTAGIVSLGFPKPSQAEDVTLQADGKIVLGGYATVMYPSGSGFVQTFRVIRLNADGTLDTTFNGTGVVTSGPQPQGTAVGYEVVVQPDGKILLGGHAGFAPTVLRFLSNGSADGAFGVGGVAQTQFGSYEFAPMFDLELRPDGRVLLVGAVRRDFSSVNDTALVRFNGDGTLDTTFTPTGRARIVIGPRAGSPVAQQADGKVVTTVSNRPKPSSGPGDTALLSARFGGAAATLCRRGRRATTATPTGSTAARGCGPRPTARSARPTRAAARTTRATAQARAPSAGRGRGPNASR
jgi:uncharacterized delta-60 repeat protein